MHECEEQAQPRELTEGDNDSFRPVGGGRKILGQWLALTIIESISIGTTAGTERTEWVEPEAFSGSIAHFANNKEEGTKETKGHSDQPGELSF